MDAEGRWFGQRRTGVGMVAERDLTYSLHLTTQDDVGVDARPKLAWVYLLALVDDMPFEPANVWIECLMASRN